MSIANNHSHLGPRSFTRAVVAVAVIAVVVTSTAGAQGLVSEPPARPTGLTGTATHNSVTLTWDDPDDPNITGYQILRRNTAEHAIGDFQVHVDDTASTATTYVDNRVKPETTYVYHIKARNGAALSKWSRPWLAVSTPAIPPPTGLTGTATHNSVTLTWDDPDDPNIAGYQILRRNTAEHAIGDFQVHADDTASTATTYVDNNVKPETNYVYRIKARNGAALSEWSHTYLAISTPAIPPRPARPTGVELAVDTAGRLAAKANPLDPVGIVVGWTAPDPTDNVQFTHLQWRAAGQAGYTGTDKQSLAANPETVSEFDLGQRYDFRLRHRNTRGSAWTEINGLLVAFEPDAPVLNAVAAADRSLVVDWASPTFTGGSDLTGHLVQWRTIGGNFDDNESLLGATNTSATIGPLVNGVAYEVRVLAENEVGMGAASTTLTGTPATTPTVPLNVSATSSTARLEVLWDPPASDGGSAIANYEVEYRTNSAEDWSDDNVSVSGLSASISQLPNGTTHEVRVRAVNSSTTDSGNGPWSLPVPSTSAALPTAPRNVSVSGGTRTLEVAWDAPRSNGDSPVAGYEVQYRSATTDDWIPSSVAAGSLSVELEGLSGDVEYEVRVRAINSSSQNAGNGPWSLPVHATPIPAEAPGRPIDVRATPIGNKQLEVTWDSPIDDGGAPIDLYEIEWKSSINGYDDFYDETNRRTTSTTTSTTIEGLLGPDDLKTQASEYRIRVRAVNDVAPGKWSATSIVQTMTGPSVPRNLKLTIVDGDKLKLTWDAPAFDNGSPIAGYDIWIQRAVHTNWGTRRTRAAAATATEFITEVLDNNRTWRFRIAAVNDAGRGEWATAKQKLYRVPNPPQDVRLTANDSSLTVEWTIDSSGESADSSRLRWRPEGTSDSAWSVVSFDYAYEIAHTISGLNNGTTYDVQVAAVNSAGESNWTAAVTSTPTADQSAPQNLQVSHRIKEITVSWDWNGGLAYPIDGFVVRWRSSSAGDFEESDKARVGRSARKYQIEDLMSNEAYTIQVTAVNGTQTRGSSSIAGYPFPPREKIYENFAHEFGDPQPWILEALNSRPMWIKVGTGDSDTLGRYVYVAGKRDGWTIGLSEGMRFKRKHLNNVKSSEAAMIVFHELAHAYSLDWRGSSAPGPLGILWFYIDRMVDGECTSSELLADTIAYEATKNNFPYADVTAPYYSTCDKLSRSPLDVIIEWFDDIGDDIGDVIDDIGDFFSTFDIFDDLVPVDPSSEARAVARSAMNGQIPDWFYDRYQNANGSIDMVKFWKELRNPDYKEDTWKLRGYLFRELFGGFCSAREALESYVTSPNSAEADEVTDNPWVDGGCKSRRPQDAEVVRRDGSLEVSWKVPLWAKEPDVDGYLVQWKRSGGSYHSSRQVILSGLSNVSTTITDLTNGERYTVRIAAIDTSRPGILRDKYGHIRYTEVSGRPAASS